MRRAEYRFNTQEYTESTETFLNETGALYIINAIDVYGHRL